ncbi:hypothetical protein HRTV-17_gp51 [Halorubrum phage HRTV-17]|uniref:Uncharacterized protein n=2 Tax=Haloferacalesvirus hv8 TaxID=1273755 RepID=A0AAE8XVJ4_9CAUD|nr:hypothetical protein HRTV-14_gp50 [Halorubrum phage HRTV-14]UBF19250.1 hypothetical protein HRTV-17_gp51 [Halorubrum phage HRTV-17]
MSELTEEQEEWATELKDTLQGLQNAAALVEGKVDEILDGDLSYAEYEEWVDANKDALEDLRF